MLAERHARLLDIAGGRYELFPINFSDVGPKAVPTVLTAELSQDCRVHHLWVSNTGSTDRTLLVQDGNGRIFMPNVGILGDGGFLAFDDGEKGRFMPGGVFWQASGAGLDGYMVIAR